MKVLFNTELLQQNFDNKHAIWIEVGSATYSEIQKQLFDLEVKLCGEDGLEYNIDETKMIVVDAVDFPNFLTYENIDCEDEWNDLTTYNFLDETQKLVFDYLNTEYEAGFADCVYGATNAYCVNDIVEYAQSEFDDTEEFKEQYGDVETFVNCLIEYGDFVKIDNSLYIVNINDII